ncbi:hypothetical protein NSK_000565 [Nannochloropsis salina CCMP1776]|uniref:Uncharacterized protein n=1 Tax=Nannochloropsis salina CCMP1776 TaxID=1027361 RepID=A0A4D9DB37_9STRA|nr:hypothetical protein NSK_000565 [Nannochloropsis salina CCMP1776]|eukprot:TFJ88214.1 hypothetical protein NSK_000565 [Nannochloropsis salina CCMP1776]
MTTVQSAKKVQDTVLIATRIHGRETTAALSFDSAKLRDFLHNTLAYADAVAVAVEVADPFHPRLLVAAQDVVKEFKGCRINVLPVTPWGHFVPALNASLSFAMQEDFSYILYLSLEMDLTPLAFRALLANFDPAEDLVVGAALEGHHFRPGRQPLTGATAPWNTCALWSVSKLSLTGFLAVSEGLASDKGMGGVEEVAVICLAQQCLQPRPSVSLSSIFRWNSKPAESVHSKRNAAGMRAKLLHLQGQISWKVDWSDPARQEWHRKKMESKLTRAGSQLRALGLAHPTHEASAATAVVWHLEVPHVLTESPVVT